MIRVGHGYDVHKLGKNRRLILGGVTIPYERGLIGHSDADVLVHAIMDSLLGAAALGDIGKLFPDTEEKWRGADSIAMLHRVCAILAEKGWRVSNIDSTVICQSPKLMPYIEFMRNNIAESCGISADCVSVKATTEGHLGFTGAGEGSAAHAVSLIENNS